MSYPRIILCGIVLGAVILCSGEPLPKPPPGDREPELVKRVEPKYPAMMARAGVTDDVEFVCSIEANGEVKEVRILKSRAPEFAKATVAAVKQWKFRPAVKNGVYVNAIMQGKLTFELHKE